MSVPRPQGKETPEPTPVVGTEAPPALTYRDLQRAVLLGFALYGLTQFAGALTTLLLFFLLVFILAAVMNPVVTRLEARGVPRIAGALALAGSVLIVVGVIGWLALPPLLDEVGKFFG